MGSLPLGDFGDRGLLLVTLLRDVRGGEAARLTMGVFSSSDETSERCARGDMEPLLCI